MSEASEFQLSITTQTHVDEEPQPSTIPKPKTGTYLYELNGSKVSMSRVRNGRLDDAETHEIPKNSWLNFNFTQFEKSKQVFDGGAITLYVDGGGGFHCHGHRAGTPSLQMHDHGETTEGGEGSERTKVDEMIDETNSSKSAQ